jgi:hypothetical protein
MRLTDANDGGHDEHCLRNTRSAPLSNDEQAERALTSALISFTALSSMLTSLNLNTSFVNELASTDAL